MSNLFTLSRLTPVRHDRNDGANNDHPMRRIVRGVASSESEWTPENKFTVRNTFGQMAHEWKLRDGIDRTEALVEALDRVDISGDFCLELGSGTGSVRALLDAKFKSVVSVDLAYEMLTNFNVPNAELLQGDSSKLPFKSNCVDVCVIVNSLLFPSEVRRILKPEGVLVWVSTNGDRTPIYLSPKDVNDAIGSDFYGVTAHCGNGIWSCFSRSKNHFVKFYGDQTA